jgi:flagellar biosynthesis/type III secretory pathway chaperone
MPSTLDANPTPASMETEIAALLNDLLAGQGELMAVLNRKRNLLAVMDHEGLAAIADEEQRLLGVLQDCLSRRQALLARAAAAGLPSGSIQALTQAMPSSDRAPLTRQVAAASSRARLLHTQNLTNWIVIQRTLIHLSQLLEIIATGGRPQPTYGAACTSRTQAALINQEA